MRFLVPALLAVAAVPAIAHADQCQLIDDDVATRALAAFKNHPKVIQFCEPCGDKAPGEPVVAERVTKERDRDGGYQIVIDKREVDLAYTYVETGLQRFENVAALAGCPASGVSPSLRVDEATSSGVMIRADSTPVSHTQIQVVEPPPSAPAITYIVQTESQTNWLAIMLAAGASSGMWAIGMIALVRRRRAVAMRPRAVELIDRTKS